jgi:hypothetical protein
MVIRVNHSEPSGAVSEATQGPFSKKSAPDVPVASFGPLAKSAIEQDFGF